MKILRCPNGDCQSSGKSVAGNVIRLVSIKPVGESAIDIDARPGRKRSVPILRLLTIDFSIAAASLITVTGAGPDNAPPRIVAAGRSVDHLVRVNGRWLIQLRDVSPKE